MPFLRSISLGSLTFSSVLISTACRTTPSDSKLESESRIDAVSLNLSEEMDPRNCKIWSETISDSMLEAARPVFGHPDYRFWYYLYFATRNAWPKISQRDQEMLVAVSPHWQIPQAAVPDSSQIKSKDHLAGESYLFVHHGLVLEMRDILSEAGQPCMSSWPAIPDPRSTANPEEAALAKDYPVPAAGSSPSKSPAAVGSMKSWEKKLKNRGFLKSITLNELGIIIETKIASPTMLRFSAIESKRGIRPRIAAKDDVQNANWAWNQSDYDLLSDTYSALVNPVFWKIHGEMDSILFRWLKANGYREISTSCEDRAGCYQWRSTWAGAKPNPKFLAEHSDNNPEKPRFSEAPDLLKLFHRSSRFDYQSDKPK